MSVALESKYKSLTEKLAAVIEKYDDDWDALKQALQALIDEAKEAGAESQPFQIYARYVESLLPEDELASAPATKQDVLTFAEAAYTQIATRTAGDAQFWSKAGEVQRLKSSIMDIIPNNLFLLENAGAIVDGLVKLAEQQR